MGKNKKESKEIKVDLKEFFDALGNSENVKEIDSEKALSLGLLYALKKFTKTSETTKYDLKAFAILSNSCDIMKDLVTEIRYGKKDIKRKRSKELKEIIKDIANNMKMREIDNSENGILSKILHR